MLRVWITADNLHVSADALGGTVAAHLGIVVSLNFGNQGVSTTSTVKTAKITNNLSTSLSINNIAASGDFSQTNDCPAQLQAGKSCTVSVTFTPTNTGTIDGAVSISDAAKTSPQILSLSGVGVPMAIMTVSATGSGTGTITSLPAGINCGNTCISDFSQGTLVNLTATPNGGSIFAGWSGC